MSSVSNSTPIFVKISLELSIYIVYHMVDIMSNNISVRRITMRKFLSAMSILVMLIALFATQVSAATGIGQYQFNFAVEENMNVATTTITNTSTWAFESTIGSISSNATYSNKEEYKFILTLATDLSGDAGNKRGFIGNFVIQSNGNKIESANNWRTSIWNIKDGGILVFDNTILMDKDDGIATGNGITVESGGILHLINGSRVVGFNYDVNQDKQASTSKSSSVKVLNGGVLYLDSKAKQEPIYCEAGAVINLISSASNIQWKINGEQFNGTTYTAATDGFVSVDFEIACTNHDYVLSSQKPNDCKNDGVNTYLCSICVNEKTEVVPADPNAHVWADGICSVCSTECEHSWSEWTLTGPSGYAENQWKNYSGHIQKNCVICQKQIDVEIPELQLGLLAEKNILMSGDSIISGYSTNIITNFTGATVTKVGVSSATVSTGKGENRLINQLIKDRLNNPNAEYDVVFLFGGINDARCETPIGQLSTDGTYDINTFIGALEELIEYAKREYPNSEIAYLIPYKTTYAEEKYGGLIDHRDDYTNAIIAVCEKWDVPYLDMYNSDMITGVLNGTRKITTTDISVGYNNLAHFDGLHLNYSGYYYMSVFVSQMAEKLILGEYQYEVVAEKIDATCGEDGRALKYNFETGTLELHIINATNQHIYTDDFNCETELICDTCKNVLISAKNHTISVNIVYENGYDKMGSKTTCCTNENCMYNETNEVCALFICLGYSAPEDGRNGIAIGYTVNIEAIKEYETITGKTLKYGVFAVAQSKLGTNDIFANDGTAADGVINAEITNYSFTSFEIVIVGFTDEYKGQKLAMGAYVTVTDGETTEYSYIQYGTPSENEKYCFITYNDIVPAKEEVTQ